MKEKNMSMPRQIYVNLPIKDLSKTTNFFSHLGFEFDPRFTDDKAACLIIGENIYAMLLKEEFFKTFTNKQIVDAKNNTEVLLALRVDSREDVDQMISRARKAGGSVPREPHDHGFMYEHAFEDLDGHIWEVFYMDPNARPNG